MNGLKVWGTLIGGVLLVILLIALAPFAIIDEGERGVVTKLGQVNRVMEPGFNLKVPGVENVVKYDVRTQKFEVNANAASDDGQPVETKVAVQYQLIPNRVAQIYGEVGTAYESVIVQPAVLAVTKDSTANFKAQKILQDRSIVAEEIKAVLSERLLVQNIQVINVDIVDVQFSQDFVDSIERKVVAEQNALTAQHDLARVEFEAQQSIEQAKAVAEKTRLETQALAQSSKLIEKIQAEAQLEAAKRWNGVLPTHMYGSAPIPLVNVAK